MVKIAVRTDARPFAWREGDNGSYRGFLFDLCTDAATRAGYLFDLYPITTVDREGILGGSRTVPDHNLKIEPSTVVDVVCDPITINLQRMLGLAVNHKEYFEFSPILFVANGSYIAGEAKPADLRSRETFLSTIREIGGCRYTSQCYERRPAGTEEADAGRRRDGNPEVTPDADPPSGNNETQESRMAVFAGYVRSTTALDTIKRKVSSIGKVVGKQEAICLAECASHEMAAKAFCKGTIKYYFGDTDILNAYITLLNDVGPADEDDCKPPRPSGSLSYEPYALLVANRLPGFRQKFNRALYEIFADTTASGRFETYFPNLQKSQALEILFRMNSIPSGVPGGPDSSYWITIEPPAATQPPQQTARQSGP